MYNYLTISAICLILLGFAHAQNTIHFDRFSVEDGLSHIKIKDVAQDADGFLWFATPDGLNRYDGYSFTRFRHEPEDPYSLPANSINTLFVDSAGTLWIGTFNGFCRYDPVLERFERFISPSDTSQSDQNSISAIGQDKKGNIWVAKGMGLYRVDLFSGTETLVSNAQKSDTSISSNMVHDIAPDPFSSGLWLATNSGVNYFDIEKNVALPVASAGRYLVDRDQYHLETQLLLEQIVRVTPPLASIGNVSNHADTSFYFSLNKPERVLLTMLGEGDKWRLYDSGRLLTSTGKEIWSAEIRKTRAAGGSPKNRLQLEFVDLPPGRYKLHYKSDESHSPGAWNSPSPKIPELWGIHLFRLTSKMEKELKRYLNQRFKPQITLSSYTTSIFADSLRDDKGRQRLWVATGAGVARLTLPLMTDTDSRYYQDEHTANKFLNEQTEVEHIMLPNLVPHKYGYYSVLDMHVAEKNNVTELWLATEGYGLIQLPIKSTSYGNARRYSNSLGNDYSLSSNILLSIGVDHLGNLWAGSENGLNKLNKRKLQFTHHKVSGNGEVIDKSFDHVQAVHIDKKSGDMLVATAAGGLSRSNRDSQKGQKYYSLASKTYSKEPLRIMAMAQHDSSSVLWLATAGNGLARYDPLKGRIDFNDKSQVHIPNSPFEVAYYRSLNTVIVDGKERVWFGTKRVGLLRVDLDSNEEIVDTYLYPMNIEQLSEIPESQKLPAREVWCIARDPYAEKPTLWIGMVGGNLSALDIDSGEFTHYKSYTPPISIGTNSKSITSLLFDKTGTLWIGTYSGGLNSYNRNSGMFEHLTVRKGLSNNMVQGILEDKKGNIWASTNDGLSVLTPKTGEIRTYDVNDGIQGNQFIRGSMVKAADGRLFFGGTNGLTSFYPDSLQENIMEPTIVLTDFRIFGKSVIRGDSLQNQRFRTDRSLTDTDKIKLSWSENFFSFNFVALDYTNPLKNEYAYMLEGFDASWIYCGDRRYASYTNLDPGSYTFRVKAANSDGVWNEKGVSVDIIIAPPFWKTWWFYLLAAIALAALAYVYHSYKLRQKVRELIAIERVRKKAAADFHDELGHKLTKISLFSEIVRQRLSESPAETVDYVKRINDISGGLYNGMRDFLWTLDPGKDSLYEALIRLKDFGDEFFDKSGIQFEVEGISEDTKAVELTMDWKRHLVLLFKEAMTNALKHSDGTAVLMRAAYTKGHFQLELIDDGCGQQRQNVAVMNGSHGNGTHASGKTGINGAHRKQVKGMGLKNMQFRAEQLGGVLEVLSNQEKSGTNVRFTAML